VPTPLLKLRIVTWPVFVYTAPAIASVARPVTNSASAQAVTRFMV